MNDMDETVPLHLSKEAIDEVINGLVALTILGKNTQLTHRLIQGLLPYRKFGKGFN